MANAPCLRLPFQIQRLRFKEAASGGNPRRRMPAHKLRRMARIRQAPGLRLPVRHCSGAIKAMKTPLEMLDLAPLTIPGL